MKRKCVLRTSHFVSPPNWMVCAICLSLFVDENENGLNLHPFFITIMGLVSVLFTCELCYVNLCLTFNRWKVNRCVWSVRGVNVRMDFQRPNNGKIEILSILFRGISCEEKIRKCLVIHLCCVATGQTATTVYAFINFTLLYFITFRLVSPCRGCSRLFFSTTLCLYVSWALRYIVY